MDISELNDILKQFHSYEDSTIQACMEYCQDKSIPLEERWNFFITEAIGKNEEPYIQKFEALKEKFESLNYSTVDDVLVNDDIITKHEVVTADRFIEDIEDLREECDEITDDLINEVKEEWLARYLGKFTMDW